MWHAHMCAWACAWACVSAIAVDVWSATPTGAQCDEMQPTTNSNSSSSSKKKDAFTTAQQTHARMHMTMRSPIIRWHRRTGPAAADRCDPSSSCVRVCVLFVCSHLVVSARTCVGNTQRDQMIVWTCCSTEHVCDLRACRCFRLCVNGSAARTKGIRQHVLASRFGGALSERAETRRWRLDGRPGCLFVSVSICGTVIAECAHVRYG